MHRGQHGFTRVDDVAGSVDFKAVAIASVFQNHSIRAGNGDIPSADRKLGSGRRSPNADVAVQFYFAILRTQFQVSVSTRSRYLGSESEIESRVCSPATQICPSEPVAAVESDIA